MTRRQGWTRRPSGGWWGYFWWAACVVLWLGPSWSVSAQVTPLPSIEEEWTKLIDLLSIGENEAKAQSEQLKQLRQLLRESAALQTSLRQEVDRLSGQLGTASTELAASRTYSEQLEQQLRDLRLLYESTISGYESRLRTERWICGGVSIGTFLLGRSTP